MERRLEFFDTEKTVGLFSDSSDTLRQAMPELAKMIADELEEIDPHAPCWLLAFYGRDDMLIGWRPPSIGGVLVCPIWWCGSYSEYVMKLERKET